MNCPICGAADCGGPTHAQAIDEPIIVESIPMANENEMVVVHVDDGTKRGHDRKFTRRDAERFMSYTPGASIVDDREDAQAEQESEAKAVEKAPENKARVIGSAEKK